MNKKTQTGFTIIELMVVVALVGVLAIVAYPDLSTMVKNNRIATQANDLIGAMNIARSSAVKRSIQANVCARATNTSCGNNWSNGWIVYLDTDTGGGTALGTLDANDLILRVREPLSGNNTITSGGSTISYRASGFTTLATGATRSFVLCDDRGNQFGRLITVLSTGRANTTKTTNQCP